MANSNVRCDIKAWWK